MSAVFSSVRDKQGYRTTPDGRWKAKEHPSGQITLTDVSRRAVFVETGGPWVRRPTWEAVQETVEAHG